MPSEYALNYEQRFSVSIFTQEIWKQSLLSLSNLDFQPDMVVFRWIWPQFYLCYSIFNITLKQMGSCAQNTRSPVAFRPSFHLIVTSLLVHRRDNIIITRWLGSVDPLTVVIDCELWLYYVRYYNNASCSESNSAKYCFTNDFVRPGDNYIIIIVNYYHYRDRYMYYTVIRARARR